MQISVIVAHPSRESYNQALARAIESRLRAANHAVIFHDLHGESFDPVYDASELRREAKLPPLVEQHCSELEKADGLVLVHPNFWSRPPAMMSGWVDRVLRPGRAYRFVPDGRGGARPEGLLGLRGVLVINTSNTPPEKEIQILGDPLEVHWRKVVFGLCGVSNVVRRNFGPVIVSTPEQRSEWLREAESLALGLFAPNEGK